MAWWLKFHCLLSVAAESFIVVNYLQEPLGNESIINWLGPMSHLLKSALMNYLFACLITGDIGLRMLGC